jgi:hypothetical protein
MPDETTGRGWMVRGRRGFRRRAGDQRANVIGRGAAAAADGVQIETLDELREIARELLRLQRVDGLAIHVQRQAGVRQAGHGPRGVLAEPGQRGAHVLGAGRAVDAHHVHRHALERREHGGDVRPEQHASIGIQGDLHLDGNPAAAAGKGILDAHDGGLCLEHVLRGLDQQQVAVAIHQRLGLLGEHIGEFLEGDVRQVGIRGGRQLAGRADGAGHESALARRGEAVSHAAREGCSRPVEVAHSFIETVLRHRDPVCAEGAGFDDVASRLEVGGVNGLDHLRPLQDEVVVAPDITLAAEVHGGEVLLLDAGAHGPIEHQDLVGQRVEVAAVRVLGRRAALRARPCASPRADGEEFGAGFRRASRKLLDPCFPHEAGHDQLPAHGHDVHAADARQAADPLDDLERNLDALFLGIGRALEAGNQPLGNADTRDRRHRPGGPRAAHRRDASQQRCPVEHSKLVEAFQVALELFDVVDEVALEELRACVRFLQFAQGLDARCRGRGRRGGAEEQARRTCDGAAVQVLLLVAHAPQDPQHLDRVEIPEVHAPLRRRPLPRVVAGQAEHVADAERRGAQDLRLERHARAIPRGDLHHRLDALRDRQGRARDR